MMISKSLKYLLLLLTLVPGSVLESGAQTTDLRLRAGVKVQKKISKDFLANIEYEHRLNNYLSTFDKSNLQVSLSYDINKNIRTGISWRASADQNRRRIIEYKQRGSVFLRYKRSIDDFDINLKTLLQYGFDDLTNPSFSYGQNLINRNSIGIEYNWFGTKLKPFIGCELFYHVNHPNGGIINNFRIDLGILYRISRNSDLSFYYLFDNEFNVAYPVDAHVIGIGYTFKF
jgi:hypothetical protein